MQGFTGTHAAAHGKAVTRTLARSWGCRAGDGVRYEGGRGLVGQDGGRRYLLSPPLSGAVCRDHGSTLLLLSAPQK